jgi:hypothetical protein
LKLTEQRINQKYFMKFLMNMKKWMKHWHNQRIGWQNFSVEKQQTSCWLDLHWYFLFVFVFISSKFDFVSILVGCFNDSQTHKYPLSFSFFILIVFKMCNSVFWVCCNKMSDWQFQSKENIKQWKQLTFVKSQINE